MEDLCTEIKKAPVTSALIILNIVIFLIVDLTGGGSEDVSHMFTCGASYTPAILEHQEYYRLFSSMFLHFGITHLLNNMLVLLVLGQKLESIVGKVKMLLIYLLGGLGGNCLSIYMDLKTKNYAVSAGASGAVFAVMGAMIYVIARNKGRLEELTTKRMIVMALLSIYLGYTNAGVDNAAHIGGLIGGMFLAILLYHPFLHK